jgi:hypothetical protein
MKFPGQHMVGLLLAVPLVLPGGTLPPESWIPLRWPGGPLELSRRETAKTVPADPALREAIGKWYDGATLGLVEGSPFNCLLMTWSAGASPELERQQQQLVATYAARARQRGIAVVGLVHPGADPSKSASAAAQAGLDGLALEGDFPHEFAGQAGRALAAAGSTAVVIPIAKNAAALRTAAGPVLAAEGVSPSARNLADMGIRGAPSSEPWIQSNIWLVRSLRLAPPWRPVWISYQPDSGSPADYARFAADAAVAGGRWVAALDDRLRAGLLSRDTAATAVWQRLTACVRFAEGHAEWRAFVPYGNLGVIVDTASPDPEMADEYLKLVARRQVPYRPIVRAKLSRASLAGFRAVLATALSPPSAAERSVLRAFAEDGGVVIGGPAWGDAPKGQPFTEVPLGKGRVVTYPDPDPESVARDMKELSLEEAGMVAFNVPSVITYASRSGDGRRLLIQLLNYSDTPAAAITIRVSGTFHSARLWSVDAEPADLMIRAADGKTDVTIPKLSLWGGVLLQ